MLKSAGSSQKSAKDIKRKIRLALKTANIGTARRKIFTKEFKRLVAEAFSYGIPTEELAKIADVAGQTIRVWCKDYEGNQKVEVPDIKILKVEENIRNSPKKYSIDICLGHLNIHAQIVREVEV